MPAASRGRRLLRPKRWDALTTPGTYLESRDADTVHQVRFVGLQQGDEGEELVLAAHLVLVICKDQEDSSDPPCPPLSHSHLTRAHPSGLPVPQPLTIRKKMLTCVEREKICDLVLILCHNECGFSYSMTLRNTVSFVRRENSIVMTLKTVVIIPSDLMTKMFQMFQKERKTKWSEVRMANADS